MMSGVKMSGLGYAGLVMALALWLYVSKKPHHQRLDDRPRDEQHQHPLG